MLGTLVKLVDFILHQNILSYCDLVFKRICSTNTCYDFLIRYHITQLQDKVVNPYLYLLIFILTCSKNFSPGIFSPIPHTS